MRQRLVILTAVLTLSLTSAARADDQQIVEDYLRQRGAQGYTINPITDDYVARTVPGVSFFSVIFRQYPVAIAPPNGLSSSNVVAVFQGQVYLFTGPDQLRTGFLGALSAVGSVEQALDEVRTWLRLSQEFSQDGFFVFGAPRVEPIFRENDALVVGDVQVTRGGEGFLGVIFVFRYDGQLLDILEVRDIVPGVRPICQATKLLDPDPLVRRMAEQDILVMGRVCKPYLDEQRAKAGPELQQAIDRIWQRIQERRR